MIVLSDAQGNIQNITPARVYQGSNDANDFNLIAPFANSNIITIGFLLPNTIDGVPTQFAQMEQPKTLNDELNTWTYKLPVAITQYYGTVRYQFKVTNQSGIIIATGSGTFEVIRGVDVDLPAEPTTDVYMQILTALSQVYADFTNKVDITYTDVQNAIEQKILNNASGLHLQRTHNGETNTLSFDDDGVKLNGHLIAVLNDITDYTYSKQEIDDKDNLVLSSANSHSDNNLEIAKNYTDNELLNYYTKAEVDNKDESVLNNAKNYTYSKEEIDIKDTALSVKIEAVEDKSDGRLKALSFEDNDQIIAWIDGTYTYVDGVTGETITPADVTIGQNIYNKNLVQNDYWVSRLPITSIDDLAILVTDKNTLNATDIKFNPANENKLSAVNVQGAIDEITTIYAEKNFVYEHAGYQTQVDFNAILENNVIKCTLDESVSDLELYTNTNYLIHIYLPLVTLTGELDDTYTFELQDKDGNLIKLNTIHQEDISETATVGDMCQIQEYDIGIGYSWTFNANYKIINDNGIISRYLVTDTIIREINTSMSGEALYNAINNSKLSPNTTVLCTSDYTNNGTTFVKGANYKIIGDYSSGELMLSWEELIPHVDLSLYATKTDIENKIENNSVLFTITADKWQDLADKEPYKFSATIDCNYSIKTTGEPVYELINNNPVNFASYGFALINVDFGSGDVSYLTPKFTFYAMEKPTESVNLRVLITAKSVELIAQEGGAV